MPGDWQGDLRYGIFTMSGEKPLYKTQKVTIPANSSLQLASFPATKLDKAGIENAGAFALLQQMGTTVSQNRLLLSTFKDYPFEQVEIKIELEDGKAIFSSDKFVWGVTIDVNGESNVQDNCFDILPGIPYQIRWNDSENKPEVLRTGNDFFMN
jgi:hypothetical protein